MFSIIICSITPAKFQAVTRNLALLLGNEPHEFIGVHDAKSLCEGYNRALAHAKGDRLIFCHDDIEVLNGDFRPKLIGHLDRFDVVGVAGSDRLVGGLWSLAGPPFIHGQIAHPNLPSQAYEVEIFSTPARAVRNIQGLDGLFLAARREVLERIRFDEQTFDGWHGYDIDFTFAAHLAGFKLGVACDINILHHSVGTIGPAWEHYARRFNQKYVRHLSPISERKFLPARVLVRTKAEVLEVMNPRYWPAFSAATGGS
jgi:GT2 family glycosyltransferase